MKRISFKHQRENKQNSDNCFYRWRQMCLRSHWLIIFNIRVSSGACLLRTDLIILWIKVSSVIQTFISGTHQKENVQFANNSYQTRFQIHWNGKILLNCSFQERPPLFRPLFSLQKVGLIKGRLLYENDVTSIKGQ